ncbi:CRAL/TRIO domain-containing protein [Corynespora cassiicola Philippines]|uniref:CRAL/TRIO domain-containing protein n=1 Tax=Corynespora cassiicola Philippines TaxID=1448308 RepID=A0A2T2NAJ4_CORCC|nr:CRAL/TRIO domain-containing protein [Corynespora cassiicola Philippines]
MADLKRIESFQYPSGHYAHLTDNQQDQLDAFKELCQTEGYYTPPGTDGKEPSHDDETLLRFLRARRFVPQEAFKQFKDTEDWRKEHGLNDLYLEFEVDEYEQTRRLYPQWLGRRDKRGIPVYLFEVAPLNSKNISQYEKDLAKAKSTSPKVSTKNLRLFALYESLTRFVQPLCSMVDRNHPETPISQSNNIVDISGVGLKQFWNLKGHMQDASQLATAHYPETLDRIFIIGAPAFFPTVWGWIKRWFDPITVSKIFILSPANVLPTLTEYIDIDNIPKKYGGNLDFEWGNMPNLEPSLEAAIKWESPATQNGKNTFPIGPIKWEQGENGEMKAVAVGKENGQPRRRTIFTVPHPIGRKAYGAPVPNTPIDEAELALTTDGTATQPTAVPTDDDVPPPSDTPTPAATPKPEEQTLPIREGTSDTRFEQQAPTHAAGQLEEGTPHKAVNDHGHGDKTVSIEPGTVGQAPKEVDVQPQGEGQGKGYVESAKEAVAAVGATVGSTVGGAAEAVKGAVVGGGDKKEEVKKEDSAIDKEVEKQDGPKVEGFLREQNGSKAPVP